MKKILYTIMTAISIFGATSCSDMLETESSTFVSNPDINQKSDSVFYVFGIFEAMQELADQYYVQNEMRGDLVSIAPNASMDLKNLASFKAGADNAYDSVYHYYKVINNCNYYLEKRDTTLKTGTLNVTINEYVGVAAFRAWTYLQLTSQYGNVPYVTNAVLTKSDINAQTASTDYHTILADQAAYLQSLKDKFTPAQLIAPDYARNATDVISYYTYGHLNYSQDDKRGVITKMCFPPVNLVLGDLYLELGEYSKALYAYYDYLQYMCEIGDVWGVEDAAVNTLNNKKNAQEFEWPIDYNTAKNPSSNARHYLWDNQFNDMMTQGMPLNGLITYIPMAVNYTSGVTTGIPALFGYDYYVSKDQVKGMYSTGGYACPVKDDYPDVVPSAAYTKLAFEAPYYYFTGTENKDVQGKPYYISSINKGDARANSVIVRTKPIAGTTSTENITYIGKPSTGYFYLYRNTSIYLRIAECLNRLGYPELAFAVLKSGLNENMNKYCISKYVSTIEYPGWPAQNFYIPDADYNRLVTGDGLPPFLSTTYRELFSVNNIKGVHEHGAGSEAVSDIGSPYTFYNVVAQRLSEIRTTFGVGGGTVTKDEIINAVEDLICDEYALEFAFEGRRFSDLLRMARHKNMAATYGGTFGDIWLSKKLENNAPGITTQNCYLPFK